MKKRKFLSLLLAVAMVALSFGAMGVGAAPQGAPSMELDRANEVIHLSGNMPGGTGGQDGAFLLYALRVSGMAPADAELGRVRWMPTYSGAIDISRFIPRRQGVPNFHIAFRWSNQPVTTANVTVVVLNPRPVIGRNDVVYDFRAQRVVVNTQLTANSSNFEVRVGDDVRYAVAGGSSGWGRPIGPDTPFPLPLRVMPTGGVVQARIAPTAGYFASMPIRVRVPRPTAPIRTVLTIRPGSGQNPYFIQGLTTNMEVFVGVADTAIGNLGSYWRPIPVRNMTVSAFSALVPAGSPGRDTTSYPGSYTFTLRNRATDTRPASEPSLHRFSVTQFNAGAAVAP